MIFRDRETGTLWQQATGEAVAGPLKGATLQLLSGEILTWAGWENMSAEYACLARTRGVARYAITRFSARPY